MRIKIFIVTYKRSDILNDTLTKIFNSNIPNNIEIKVNIINNHTEFNLNDEFKNKVEVLHNMTRPNWSNGNLAENWNQALIHGFKNLKKPNCDYVVTLQNDTSVHKDWCKHIIELHKKYNFLVGKFGDNFVSYTPEAVKKIGLWDERFCGIQYKESDYFIRALIFNKEKSMINDTMHGQLLNNKDALELDTSQDRNIQIIKGREKRRPDDKEQKIIWNDSRNGKIGEYLFKYFKWKWSGTWHKEPEKKGWIFDWPKEFVDKPPKPPKPEVMKYHYFEENIENRNYIIR